VTVTDEDAIGPFSFTSTGGGTVTCNGIGVQHVVDSEIGEVGAGLSIGGSTACRGTITIEIQYTDDHGDASHIDSTSQGASLHNLRAYDAGSNNVTADYQVVFADCASNCVQTLQTTTK
jgi:hypothetical protein